ncbi:hypothetical protein [uncultured Dokdonia sp.]|uniref:hypothetical protein n=1 Tax=uncultured Dokdonia sp. TaxID=575653 RepID=UPI00262DD665|nr:hypothetical protein [uncultured Dokdonia sp.]
MITLIQSSNNTKLYYDLIDTDLGNYKSISKKLQNWIVNNSESQDLDIVEYIKENIEEIITSLPRKLQLFINEFINKGFQNRIYDSTEEELQSIGKELEKIFNYKSFRSSKKAIWLAKTINIKSCVTCNTQFALTTHKKGEEKLLFHLDHYFPKSVYPYLSLSYYNLIPCCASCNMGKSNKIFTLENNIHPYLESFHEIAAFKIKKESLLKYLINTKENEDLIRYEVNLREKYIDNDKYEEKLNNYLREYRIEEQYIQFKDVASELFLKSKYYHKSRRKEIIDFFECEGIKVSHELIKRFIIGNYYQDKDLLKRPLAKFTQDIAKQLKLI